MTDWSKPQSCGECGQMVMANTLHTFEDCRKWKTRLERKKRMSDKKELSHTINKTSLGGKASL